MSGVFNYLGRPRVEELEPSHELVKKAGGRQLYVLLDDFAVDTPEHGVLVARKGMVTDGASIPTAAQSIISPALAAVNYPATIHDAGYERQGDIRADGGTPLTREEVDLNFSRMLLAAGVPRWQAWLAYRAVRAFGGARWQPSVQREREVDFD